MDWTQQDSRHGRRRTRSKEFGSAPLQRAEAVAASSSSTSVCVPPPSVRGATGRPVLGLPVDDDRDAADTTELRLALRPDVVLLDAPG